MTALDDISDARVEPTVSWKLPLAQTTSTAEIFGKLTLQFGCV